ncbi:hypothetical protein [Paenibacillus massiliensis]|uniref:hypothetical protein n=1 Tax=Paenibacillus massiliensis TaxID=225917 RepID=UPI00037AA47F|nr:hypothetical protein [Paenibacillus massiliensis]
MEKALFYVLAIVMIFLTACSNKIVSFQGEGDNWIVTSTVQSDENSSSYQYVIKFKGEVTSSFEQVDYKFISENIHVKETAPFEKEIERRGENRQVFVDEDQFFVEFDWNGKTERVTVNKE